MAEKPARIVNRRSVEFSPAEVRLTPYNGKKFTPGQSNNAYIFSGVGIGCIISGAIRVHDDVILGASVAVGKILTEEQLDQGMLYPPLENIRDISAHIAASVAVN